MTTLDNANSEQIRSYLSLENDFTAAAHSAAEALAKAKEQLGDIEERAEQSEEGAYAARAAANDLLSDYQTTADSVSLLTAEEADLSRSAELMQSLVQETLGYPEATDEHLSELMERARQELLSCSSQAEEELQSKRQALSEAREKERLLQIDSGAMQLSACVEQLRQLVNQDELALCRHEIEQQDLQQRLNEGRARIAGNLSSIIEKRAGLGEAIDSYRSKTETIQQLEADEARHDQIIEKLTADMKQIGADIIPHSQSICKLETEVSSLSRELDSVSADAERSASLRQELEQQLSGKRDELERLTREAAEETERLARETEQRVTAAKQEKDEKESLLEQIKTKLESDRQSFRKAQEELPYAEATKAELEQSLAQARKSAADTERMINSAASARQGMQSGSGGVLNNLESVLKKTLDSTRGLVSKLEGDLSEAAASLTEKQESFRLFSQQVNEGSQRHDQLEQQARDAAARYEQAVSETAAASEEAKARHSRLLNAAESALTETEERFRAADAELSKHSGNREQLSARLSQLTQQLDQTKEEYGEVRRRVTQLNEEIESEVIQKTSDLDQKLLDYWEESKTNLRQCQISHNSIRDMIEQVRRDAGQEQQCLDALTGDGSFDQALSARRQQASDLVEEIGRESEALRQVIDNGCEINSPEIESALAKARTILDDAGKMSDDAREKLAAVPAALALTDGLELDIDAINAPIPAVDDEPYLPARIATARLRSEAEIAAEKEPTPEDIRALIMNQLKDAEQQEAAAKAAAEAAAAEEAAKAAAEAAAAEEAAKAAAEAAAAEEAAKAAAEAAAAEEAAKAADEAPAEAKVTTVEAAPAAATASIGALIMSQLLSGEKAGVQQAPAEEAPIEDAPIIEEAPVIEEAPAVDDAPAEEEAPAVEEAPAIEEAPLIEETPAEEAPVSDGAVPAAAATSIGALIMSQLLSGQQAAPAEGPADESPNAEAEETPVPVQEEAAKPVPAAEVKPKKRGLGAFLHSLFSSDSKKEAPAKADLTAQAAEEAKQAVEQATAVAEAPVIEEAPAVEEAPVVEEAPAIEEAPVIEEAPLIDETPVIEEASVIEETPLIDEAPADEEAPLIDETPLIDEEPASEDAQSELAQQMARINQEARLADEQTAREVEQMRQENDNSENSDSDASALAAEIDAMRRRLALEEDPDVLTGMGIKDSRTQSELDAIQRSLQIAREEEAAQKRAEEEAARLAEAEASRRLEEDQRLTRIAQEAADKLSGKAIDPEAAAKANSMVSDIYMGRSGESAADSDDEDLEAELRRLIFSDLDKK